MTWFRRGRRDPLWRISRTDADFETCPESAAAYRVQLLRIRYDDGTVSTWAQPIYFATLPAAERARRRLQADNPTAAGSPSWAMACVFDQATGANLTVPGGWST